MTTCGAIGVGALFVAAILVMGWAARAAAQRGRTATGWGALTGLAGAVGFGAGYLTLAGVFAADDTSGSNLLLLVSYAPGVGGFGLMLAVVAIVHRLPPHVSGRRTAWAVHLIATDARPAAEGTLVLGQEDLRFDPRAGEPVVIPRGDLEEAVPDGEALRLRWRHDGREDQMLLTPTGGPDTRAWRMAQSAMIAVRVLARRATG